MMHLPWERAKQELREELESHLNMAIADRIARGEDPAEARAAALREFGNLPIVEDVTRERWGWMWFENLLRDTRYALRSLCAIRGYTITLVCTLALGLGCVTAMLAIVQSVLLLPLDLPHPERLVQIYANDISGGFSATPHALSYQSIAALRRESHSFAGLSGYNTMVQPVKTEDSARVSPLMEVTPGFFDTLGVRAKLGRVFGPEEIGGQVAVVSDGFWRERLNGDPKAIGKPITILGKQRTVIGTLPEGFQAPGMTGAPVVFLPISVDQTGADEFKIESAAVIGRLKPGVSIEQARAEAQSIFAHSGHFYAEKHRQLWLRPYQELVAGDMQRPLYALLGAALILLLIASANAANLQIGRATSRIPELSIRSALGASFWRLMQQIVTENVLVSLVGAALGGGLAAAGVAAARHAYAGKYPRFDELAIHPLVLCAECALAVLVGVFASLAPAVGLRRNMVARSSERTTTRKSRLPGLLVVAQVALTCVLLVISGLFVRTLRSLENVQLGFDPHGVTTLVLMPENQQQDPQISRQVETMLLRRFQSLPGIQSVAMQSELPFSSYNVSLKGTADVEGRTFNDSDMAYYSLVSTDFVGASGIHLTEGRGFQPADESSSAIAVLVNEAFVKMFLRDRQPVGATIRFHRNPGETDADVPYPQAMTVVGVVQNELQGGDLGAPYEPMVYIDYLALPNTSFLSAVFSMSAQYAVRSTLPAATVAAELRKAIMQDAPTMVEMSLNPMRESITESLGQRQLALRLVAGSGVVALILSAIGIYGVLAYSVALRRREIGIRMALGSTRRRAAGVVVRQAGMMVLVGIASGIVGSWAAGYAVRSFLYGVKALDAEALVAAGLVLLFASTIATFVPAMRAAQVDPVETLRAQ